MSKNIKALEAELNAKIALVDSKLKQLEGPQFQLPKGKTLVSMNYRAKMERIGKKRKYHKNIQIRTPTLYVPGTGNIFMRKLTAKHIKQCLYGSNEVYTVDELKDLGVKSSLLEAV